MFARGQLTGAPFTKVNVDLVTPCICSNVPVPEKSAI